MVFALSGLIAFQAYWINNALELSKTQFSRNVRESLVQVADRLEEQEAMRLTQNTFVFYSQVSDSGKINVQRHAGVKNLAQTNGTFEFDAEKDTLLFLSSTVEGSKLKKKVELIDVAVQRFITTEQKDIRDRVKEEQLDSLLSTALSENGISTSYVYGIIERPDKITESDTEKIILASRAQSPPDVLNSEFRATLFPNDIQGTNHFLAVYFPNQSAYVLRQIAMTLAASILFIGIILGSFIYTMKVIGRQKKLSEMKSDFINNMTHEFKTPIATISLATQVLSEPDVNNKADARQKYINVIRDENERLSRQVERVLETARMAGNESFLVRRHISLNDLVRESADTFAAVNPVDLNLSLKAEPDKIDADEHHIRNVINNLLENAVKYSADACRVEISTLNKAGRLELSVKDHGIGIAASDLSHIFDSFYRVPTGNRHDVKGFGLGLSYVKHIVELHGGVITVNSRPGSGSEFIISLPNVR